MSAIAFAIEALNVIPSLISAGRDIIEFIDKTNDSLKDMQANDRDPTDAEWEELNLLIENLRASRPTVD